MGLETDWFRRAGICRPVEAVRAEAGEAIEVADLKSAAFLEWLRHGGTGGVTVEQALRNPAVFRSVSLISFSIGMLPLHLIDRETKDKATGSPLYRLLQRRPNDWQTPFNFRQLMQRRMLIDGNAYALIVRSGGRPVRLVPLPSGSVRPRQRNDWSLEYVYTPPDGKGGGGQRVLAPDEVLHLYGDSDDGICGVSLVKRAADAIELANTAQLAAERLYRNGQMVGGYVTLPHEISPEAYERLRAQMEDRYRGPENSGKWMLLEQGADAKTFSSTMRDSQHNELRARQIEEIARVFGVPRPLLMVDETSWGSGIAQLARMFVDYGLAPLGVAWGQAVERALMTDAEQDRLMARFNFGALLQGSVQDQADYFAKALGSGGHPAWLSVNEVRDLSDYGAVPDGDRMNPGAVAPGNTEES